MADYASAVTLRTRKPARVGNTSLGMLAGEIDVTNYNSTTTKETDITRFFREIPSLSMAGATDEGYVLAWDRSTGKIKAFKQASAGAMVEVDDDTDVGSAAFIAVGNVG